MVVSSLMQVHWFSLFSFQRVTLLSPPVTARILPVIDQLTDQTTSSNVWRMVGDQFTRSVLFQMITWRSCEAEAIWERGRPIEGAQATSRTQSECASRRFSSTQRSFSSRQMRTQLSQPPLAKRFTIGSREEERWSKAGSGLVEGHQVTALQPIVWALVIFLQSQTPYSVLQVNTEMEPSELPQANIRPYSAGAKATEFTDESWFPYSYLQNRRFKICLELTNNKWI